MVKHLLAEVRSSLEGYGSMFEDMYLRTGFIQPLEVLLGLFQGLFTKHMGNKKLPVGLRHLSNNT